MSDVFSKEKRSEVMKAVKSKNTKTTELKMIQIFKELKISGWRRTYPLIGKPDFVFPKKRVAVFVDGCFGMAMIVVTFRQKIILIFGVKRELTIKLMIKRLITF